MQGCDIMAAFRRSAIVPDELEDTAPPLASHIREPLASHIASKRTLASHIAAATSVMPDLHVFGFWSFWQGYFWSAPLWLAARAPQNQKLLTKNTKNSILDTCRSKPTIAITKNSFWSARSGWQPEHQKTKNSYQKPKTTNQKPKTPYQKPTTIGLEFHEVRPMCV